MTDTEGAHRLHVNADWINEVLAEEGVPDSGYLAVKIANRLDPPDNPNWDATQVARLYLALKEDDALTRYATRQVAILKAAFALGMERAAKLCEERAGELGQMALYGLTSQSRCREAMEATATRMAATIREASATHLLANERGEK